MRKGAWTLPRTYSTKERSLTPPSPPPNRGGFFCYTAMMEKEHITPETVDRNHLRYPHTARYQQVVRHFVQFRRSKPEAFIFFANFFPKFKYGIIRQEVLSRIIERNDFPIGEIPLTEHPDFQEIEDTVRMELGHFEQKPRHLMTIFSTGSDLKLKE